MLALILLGVAVLAVAAVLLTCYTVVDPNMAHVVVFMGSGRKVYSATGKTHYFYIPFLMRRTVLPLTNRKMDIDGIHLHDKDVAPFICDVIAWLRISDPVVAAERLNPEDPFPSLENDLVNVVQSIARAAAMKQEILDIMRDRQTFSKEVSKEVGDVLNSWGVELVNLEVNDIRDDASKGSSVIDSYEQVRRSQVESESRKQVAIRNREAVEVEQENLKQSNIAMAISAEATEKRNIEKEKNVGIADQDRLMAISDKEREANEKHVAALRTAEVGKAEVAREAAVAVATGEAEAIRVKGEKEADVVKLKGDAEASAIEKKGLAEAVAKDKMAEAVAKFNEAGTNIEKLKAWVEVEKAKYAALGEALSKADLKLVQSGAGANLFGIPLNAETGADLGQMLEGIDPAKIGALVGALKSKA